MCFLSETSKIILREKYFVQIEFIRGVFSGGEEHYGNDLIYRRPEVRGRKSEYNEAGTQSNQRQDVMYGGTFSTLISQLSTTFLPWNISCWIPNFKIELIFGQTM